MKMVLLERRVWNIALAFIFIILMFEIFGWSKFSCGIMNFTKSYFSKRDSLPIELRSNSQEYDRVVTNNFENYYKEILRNNNYCPKAVIFARSRNYGIGNYMIEYLSTWATAKESNFTPVVSDKIFTSLNYVFDSLSVIPASTFLAYLDEPCKKKFKRIFDKIKPTEDMEELDKQLSARRAIVLRPTTCLVEKIVSLRHEVKKEFRLRQKYWTYAQETLDLLNQNLIYPNESYSETTYVGIHVRMAHYHKNLRLKYGLNSEQVAGVKYFLNASQFMLKRLQEIGKSKIIFVVLSDDMKWTTKELVPELQNYIETKNLLRNVRAVWCGTRDYRKDFALLSSCNHSILAYGRFGISSALVAGGWTLVYNVTFDGRTKSSGAMHFASDISGWDAMN